MSFFSTISYNILPFIAVLSILVFVHEMGHYLVARWNKVKIDVFSIGFGPEIFGWTDANLTRWKISLIPMGGYVKMSGDLNAASQPDISTLTSMNENEKNDSLFYKTVGQRFAISIAGPLANYLFAILIMGTFFIFKGQPIPSTQARIGQLSTINLVASSAGLKPGDVIQSINGISVNNFFQAQEIIQANPNRNISLNIYRDATHETLSVNIIPSLKKVNGTELGVIGISPHVEFEKKSFFTAYFYACMSAGKQTYDTLCYLGRVIIGQQSADGLSGPLGIASVTADHARQSISALIWLTAILSINSGLINLFPVPMLDGGHLLFYTIEAIRGKPVSEYAQEWGYRIGSIIILGLVIISTWNDLKHLKVIEFITNFF